MLLFGAILSLAVACCSARIHKLTLANDTRPFFAVSTFGLLTGGSIDLEIDHVCSNGGSCYSDSSRQVSTFESPKLMGFIVFKNSEASVNYYLETLVLSAFRTGFISSPCAGSDGKYHMPVRCERDV
jgi:hypothetical protein